LSKFEKVSEMLTFIFIYFCSVQIFAQNSIEIEDTNVGRETYVDIPLIGTISAGTINSLRIEIIYDSRIIDISSAAGDASFAIREAEPGFTTDFTKLDSALVTISSTNAVPISNGVICNLRVKGLVYSDSIAYVLPIRLFVNDQEVPIEATKGEITVIGTPIFPNFPDNLSHGYPNPFNYQVRFNFSLEKTSKVAFKLFNMSGRQIIDSDNSQDMFEFFDSISNARLTDLSNLSEGSYYLLFTPKNYLVSSGLYILTMQTDRQVFNTNIIYSK